MKRGRRTVARWSAWAVALLMSTVPLLAAPGLRDATPVLLRLHGVINSETSHSGQPLEFSVANDLVIDGKVVIKKGAFAGGIVVKAKRARWGWTVDGPRLKFKFTHTIACTGEVIALRASPEPGGPDGVVAD